MPPIPENSTPHPARATVVLFDLDRTITRGGTYTPFLLACGRRRGRSRLRLLRAAPSAVLYLAGRISRGALKSRMLALFAAGAARRELALAAEDFVADALETVRPGALAAIARHRAAGHRLVLVTASFDFYAQAFANMLGFDELIATVSVWDAQERLVAAIAGENCYGAAKLAAVKRALATREPPPAVIAYADHHTDFALLRWADEGIAVNPGPTLRRLAQAHGMASADWDAP
jgi:HAD superfamily hydrolase (TIGR01490 family)